MVDINVQIITAITGLVATAGGVLISYLTLRHTFRKDRHTIKLKMDKSLIAWPQAETTKLEWSKEQLTFGIANVGAKDFTVVSIGIEIGRRSGSMYINQPNGTVSTPYKLLPDETCSFWTEYEVIVGKIDKPKLYNKVKIRGYVRDYLGNTFYSNKLVITLRETRKDAMFTKLKKYLKDFFRLLRP